MPGNLVQLFLIVGQNDHLLFVIDGEPRITSTGYPRLTFETLGP